MLQKCNEKSFILQSEDKSEQNNKYTYIYLFKGFAIGTLVFISSCTIMTDPEQFYTRAENRFKHFFIWKDWLYN